MRRWIAGGMVARWWVALCVLACAPLVSADPAGKFEVVRVKTELEPRAEIDLWYLPAGRPKGTLFVLHGYNNSKGWSQNLQWVRDREDWNVVMPDFRNHGASSRMLGPSTLGYYEIDDVQAVVDWAERRNLQRPFVIYGRSMGGSTGIRFAARDKRIEGVLAVSPFKNAELATRQMAEYAVRLAAADRPGQSRITAGLKSLVGKVATGALESYLDGKNPLPEKQREMLRSVDVPTAVAARDDLRIWIMSGEQDSFPPADQRAILDASKSPAELKRLVVTPGTNHRNTWAYTGEDGKGVLGHDAFVKEFLKASLAAPPGKPAYAAASRRDVSARAAAVAIGATLLLAIIAVALFAQRVRVRGRRVAAARLPAPSGAAE
ncbi:MAG TPA: alpha/beta fold hydrolase [Tepidisphaeraceae bacterium]|nr:alpha/beta fold hydrolase [Tepidisphaeraceae bacterium]